VSCNTAFARVNALTDPGAVPESVSTERVDVSGETGRLIERILLRPRNMPHRVAAAGCVGQPGQAIITRIDCG
jgi:hypothetical protein